VSLGAVGVAFLDQAREPAPGPQRLLDRLLPGAGLEAGDFPGVGSVGQAAEHVDEERHRLVLGEVDELPVEPAGHPPECVGPVVDARAALLDDLAQGRDVGGTTPFRQRPDG
jgi:hypothetical protein